MNDSSVRRAQIAFLVVLAISAGQVLWWLIDQSLFARRVHDRWKELYEADVTAAISLLERGARQESIQQLFPHLEVSLEEVIIAPRALAELAEERRSHLNQYAWEGAFFLIVIFTGMGVILRAVRRDARLRRWQTNFLAAVSHELKSPLASLQLAAETLEIRESDPEHRRRLVTRILADADRLATMVAKVLDTERLDQRHVPLKRQRLSLAEAVAEALAEHELRAREARVEVRVEVPEQLAIEADPVGVRTVLRNLLDNALKATRDDGGHVLVRARETPAGVRLDVTDDGVGFAPEEASHLFDKFYRVGDELRRTRPGTGLGLYLTRRFVELEGGKISARSDGPGLGAIFTVTWPRIAVS